MRAIGWDLFIEAPGAAAHHHAYIHGLLEHSVEVAEMAVELGRISPAREGISWDAVIAGALCHDIGKVTEYVWRGLPIAVDRRTLATTYHTASGQLVLEHAWHADRTLLEAAGVTLELVRHTQHVIESHHFTKEHGSLTPPSSVEAALVSAADEASARVSARWTDAISSPCDDEHWVDPIGYRKTPVWRPVGSISVSSATERGTGDNAQLDPTLIVVERWARLVATTSARAASAVEAGEGECGVSIIPTSDDDPDDVAMSGSSAETQTHAPALHTNEFSRRRPLTMRAMEYTDAERDVYLATYVCWLVRRDLEHWDSRRTLSREDAEWMVQQLEAELPPRSLERLQRLLAAA